MSETTAPAVGEAGPTISPAGQRRDAPRTRGRGRGRIAVGSALTVGVLLAALRVHPQVWGDPGVWLSVGARLLEGDRLYADVFDNKDPFFLYSYAAGLRVAGVRGPFIFEVGWLALGTAALALALRALRVGPLPLLAGALVYPFALTAGWYVSGATLMPALALAPVALWLWARGFAAGAGAVVAVSMLFKLNLGLVVAAPLVVLLALGSDVVTRRRQALQGLGGAAAAAALATVLFAIRGELVPYLDTIAYNIHYSDAGVGGGGVRAHLEVVRVFFAAAGKWQLPAAVLGTATLVVTTIVGWARFGASFRRVSAVAIGALCAGLVTLGLTAIFVAHLQLLAYPAALGAATLVFFANSLWKPLGAATAAVLIAFAGWSSLKHENLSQLSWRTWTVAPVSTPGVTLESARRHWFPDAQRVSYAVFGRNTDDGHAVFLDGAMDLSCRYFDQYPFYRDEQLQETIDCVRRERPMLILVTTSLYDPMPGQPGWERFVAEVRALLASRYELVTEEGMSQVWKRR